MGFPATRGESAHLTPTLLGMADLHSIAHELYGLPIAEFIQTRDAWAATERYGGDALLAKHLRALRKPSTTAWVLNRLARSQPDLLEEVVELGAQLRQAQARADGERMRSLDSDRRRLMVRVAAEAAAVAEQHDQSLGSAAADGIDETIKAALADPNAGRAMLDGMLVTGLSAPGLGAVDLTDAIAIESEPARTGPARDDNLPAEMAAARKSVTVAGRGAVAAARAAATARAKLDTAVERQSDLRRQFTDLADQLEKLEQQLNAAEAKVQARRTEVNAASTDEAAALQSLDVAESRLADLDG